MCNKQWTPSHTKVVCRQLGYGNTGGTLYIQVTCSFSRAIVCVIVQSGSYETSQAFGVGTYPIAMDYVKCTGSEAELWNCPHFNHSYSECDHSHDVGVHCQPGKNFAT